MLLTHLSLSSIRLCRSQCDYTILCRGLSVAAGSSTPIQALDELRDAFYAPQVRKITFSSQPFSVNPDPLIGHPGEGLAGLAGEIP